jgi:hypothetical protein
VRGSVVLSPDFKSLHFSLFLSGKTEEDKIVARIYACLIREGEGGTEGRREGGREAYYEGGEEETD